MQKLLKSHRIWCLVASLMIALFATATEPAEKEDGENGKFNPLTTKRDIVGAKESFNGLIYNELTGVATYNIPVGIPGLTVNISLKGYILSKTVGHGAGGENPPAYYHIGMGHLGENIAELAPLRGVEEEPQTHSKPYIGVNRNAAITTFKENYLFQSGSGQDWDSTRNYISNSLQILSGASNGNYTLLNPDGSKAIYEPSTILGDAGNWRIREKISPEGLTTTYDYVDDFGQIPPPPVRIETITDHYGRQLKFRWGHYDDQDYGQSASSDPTDILEHVDLIANGVTTRLASFTYTHFQYELIQHPQGSNDIGQVGRDLILLESVSFYEDTAGQKPPHTTLFEYDHDFNGGAYLGGVGRSNNELRFKKITNSRSGSVEFDWGNPDTGVDNPLYTGRMKSATYSDERVYQYDYEHFYHSNPNPPDEAFPHKNEGYDFVKVKLEMVGPSNHDTLKTESIYLAGESYYGEGMPPLSNLTHPLTGSKVWKKSTYAASDAPHMGESTVEETFSYHTAFLWNTTFLPPYEIDIPTDQVTRNERSSATRLDTHRIKVDGQWQVTTHGYSFNKATPTTTSGLDLSAAILTPQKVSRHYEDAQGNRVLVMWDDIEHDNDIPFSQIQEFVGSQTYVLRRLRRQIKTIAPNHLAQKFEFDYHNSQYPALPTETRAFFNPFDFLRTVMDYHPKSQSSSSTNKTGMLSYQYVGDAETQTRFLTYKWGVATNVDHPVGPNSIYVVDPRGNVTISQENSVTTFKDYDLLNRVTKTFSNTGLIHDQIAEYAPSNSLENSVTFYSKESSTIYRRKIKTVYDTWNRIVRKDKDIISNNMIGTTETTYRSSGITDYVSNANHAKESIIRDVLNRPKELTIRDSNGQSLKHVTYDYEATPDGGSKVTETHSIHSQASDSHTKITVTDAVGRTVRTSLNELEVFNPASLTSPDFTEGGFTTFRYEFDGSHWTTVMMPYGQEDGRERILVKDLLGRVLSVSDPEMDGGTSRIHYNARGLAEITEDAGGLRLKNTYDLGNRLSEVRRSTGYYEGTEQWGDVVLHNTYHPDFGYIEKQVWMADGQDTRVVRKSLNPDALGRPRETSVSIPQNAAWSAQLARETSQVAGTEQWELSWNPLPTSGSRQKTEYVVELTRPGSSKTSLYFAQIFESYPPAERVVFTLTNAMVKTAIEQQIPPGHVDHHYWNDQWLLGQQHGTVLEPDVSYTFRVTGIRENLQPSQPSNWSGLQADLIVDDLDVQINGSHLKIDFRIFNMGDVASGSFTTRVYLSQNQSSTGAQEIAIFTTSQIHPGLAEILHVPWTPIDGHAYVVIEVDTGQDVIEQNENNNTGLYFLDYIGNPDPNRPDLYIDDLEYSFIYREDAGLYDLYSTHRILNQSYSLPTDHLEGDGRSILKFYFSSDNIISPQTDEFLTTTEVPRLAPREDEIKTVQLSRDVDTAIPLHQTILLAKANAGIEGEPQVNEGSNDYNNVRGLILPQLEETGADLAVANLVHDNILNGQLTVRVTVVNSGVWEAGANKLKFYASHNSTWDAQDTPLQLVGGGNAIDIEPLSDHTWSSETEVTLHIPAPYISFISEKFLIAEVDTFDDVPEGNEHNNRRTQSLLGVADLVLQNVSYNVVTGQFSFRVKNVKNLASEPTTAQLFLSTEEAFQPWGTRLDAFNIPALPPGQLSTVFTTPPGWEPPSSDQDQWLMCVVDPDNTVNEFDESNNISPLFFIEAGAGSSSLPDLLAIDWGFTRDIFRNLKALGNLDVEISEVRAELYEPPLFPGMKFPLIHGRLRAKSPVPLTISIHLKFSQDSNFNDANNIYKPSVWEIEFEGGELDHEFHTPLFPDALSASPTVYGPNGYDFVQVIAEANQTETNPNNNDDATSFSAPDVMMVHRVKNQGGVGTGPFTVTMYMSRNNTAALTSGDYYVGLYRKNGFNHSGHLKGEMVDCNDPNYIDLFGRGEGWFLKILIDYEEEVDESNETNNVLIVDANLDHYSGPYLPRGLFPDETIPGGSTPPVENLFEVTASSSPASYNHYWEQPGNGKPGSEPVQGGNSNLILRLDDTYVSENGQGIKSVSFKVFNGTPQPVNLRGLSIFATTGSTDLSGADATLVYSTDLAGDRTGHIINFPSTVAGNGGTTPNYNLNLRIPKKFENRLYHLIFATDPLVTLGWSTSSAINEGQVENPEVTWLYFDKKRSPGFRILGHTQVDETGE